MKVKPDLFQLSLAKEKGIKIKTLGGMNGMELGRIGNQIIEFQKSTFDDTFNAMVMFQDQTEKMFNTFLEQAGWIPEEGKRMIDEWVIAYKKGREDFKNAVDDNFKRVEDLFATFEK